jgi:hypothetical protein
MTAPNPYRWFLEMVVVLIILYLIATAVGCSPTVQPIQIEPGEQRIMLIPKGTRIGDVVTDANGLYIGEEFPGDVLLLPPGSVDEMQRERKEFY